MALTVIRRWETKNGCYIGLSQKLFPNVIHKTLARTLGTSFESTRELKKERKKKMKGKKKWLLKSTMEFLERVNALNIQRVLAKQ